MSQNSKTISARVPYEKWLEIIQQASDLKMSVSDWLLLQIEKARYDNSPLKKGNRNHGRSKK